MDADVSTRLAMEEILIEAVRRRPSIYDKTKAVYRSSTIREQDWHEVAQAVNITDVDTVKKRWRTLRDSFIKIQRSLKHNPSQVVKWIYYKRLMFLTPHIESKEVVVDGASKTDDEETQDTPHVDCEADSGSDFLKRLEVSDFLDKVDNHRAKKRNVEEDPLSPEPFVRRKIQNDEFRVSMAKEMDADEQFLLSCLPALKRLRPRENAIARMRIQQVLFDVEFGEDEQSDRVVTKVEELE